VYGDVGIVLYQQKTTATGYSDPKMNVELETSVVDTWQKAGGKWKVLVTANVSKHAMRPDKY
jgi:hypothetical protein